MKELSLDVINFLEKQGFVIVSTIDDRGRIHCAAKGIVGIEKKGKVYLIDIYRARTFSNLQKNPTISITAVDEHLFIGYTLKGKAKIVERERIRKHIIKKWEERVIQRISKRLIKNVKEDRKSLHHPETRFPHPQYLIEVDVEDIVDLTPAHLAKLSL
ncbi:MAG: pyridoxamine 5'-phosphate oxidase family protein [Candidatus Omnitrophota bacterium]|nr:pyridoxamine 5'-phosphate oxidase family protein [Candidatus Omnitrophota bacterium]